MRWSHFHLLSFSLVNDYDLTEGVKEMSKNKKSGFFSEFKTFIMRGNVLDMAVGIVIGGAFTAIVTSVVQDIINPLIGLLIGKIDFSELKITLIPASESAGEVAIRYGVLIQTIIQFLLTAFVLFLIIRGVNNMRNAMNAEEIAEKKKKDEEAKAKKEEEDRIAEAKKDEEEARKEEVVILLKDIKNLIENK